MTDQTVRVLTKARKLIDIGWTRGVAARNIRQREIELRSPEAVCFSLWGALQRATHELKIHDMEAHRAARLLDRLAGGPISEFNDAQQYKRPVLDLLDRAIRETM